MDVPRLLRPLSRVPRWSIFGFALIGLLLQAFGLYWDIWRHVVVGRESFFTPPHLVLYAGFGYVALAGLVGRTRRTGARPAMGLVGVALGAGVLLFSLQVLLGPMDFASSFTGQVLRDAIAYPTGVSLAAPAVLVLAVLAGRRPGLATVSAAIYTGLRSLMVVGAFALPPPILFLAPAVDLAFLVLGPRNFGLVA